MALNAYLAQVNQLLQNPQPTTSLYSNSDLTSYINEGRQKIAEEGECIRGSSSANTTGAQQDYLFSLFSSFFAGGAALTGVSGVLDIRQIGIASGGGFQLLIGRSYEWFFESYIATGAPAATGQPKYWAQLGRGTKGTFSLSPIPTGTLGLIVDVTLLPSNLASDADPEAIPSPWTDAVQFYGAYRALMSSQRTKDADVMFARYREYMGIASKTSVPTALPGNFPGGLGAAIAGAKTPIVAQAQGGGR